MNGGDASDCRKLAGHGDETMPCSGIYEKNYMPCLWDEILRYMDWQWTVPHILWHSGSHGFVNIRRVVRCRSNRTVFFSSIYCAWGKIRQQAARLSRMQPAPTKLICDNNKHDADTGRFTALDPMGAKGGDKDWYGYCVDDPVNRVDVWGLEDEVTGRRAHKLPAPSTFSETPSRVVHFSSWPGRAGWAPPCEALPRAYPLLGIFPIKSLDSILPPVMPRGLSC